MQLMTDENSQNVVIPLSSVQSNDVNQIMFIHFIFLAYGFSIISINGFFSACSITFHNGSVCWWYNSMKCCVIRRSTTLSLVWHHSSPTRWHFAAHMGQLMRDSVDAFGGPMGCAELWPQCPFSSQLLLQLSKRNFKRNWILLLLLQERLYITITPE